MSTGRDLTKPIMGNLQNGILNFGLDNICSMVTIFWAMKNAQASMRLTVTIYLCNLYIIDLWCGVRIDARQLLKCGGRVFKISGSIIYVPF